MSFSTNNIPPTCALHRVCVLHHFFRIDPKHQFTLFETYYMIMVTMSTVGYGDFSPAHWTGRLLITIFVISAIIYLIPHLENLYEAFQTQQKLHNSVNVKKAGLKHILICATHLKPLVLRDFLTEFYSDPDHLVSMYTVYVCVGVSMSTRLADFHPSPLPNVCLLIELKQL